MPVIKTPRRFGLKTPSRTFEAPGVGAARVSCGSVRACVRLSAFLTVCLHASMNPLSHNDSFPILPPPLPYCVSSPIYPNLSYPTVLPCFRSCLIAQWSVSHPSPASIPQLFSLHSSVVVFTVVSLPSLFLPNSAVVLAHPSSAPITWLCLSQPSPSPLARKME